MFEHSLISGSKGLIEGIDARELEYFLVFFLMDCCTKNDIINEH